MEADLLKIRAAITNRDNYCELVYNNIKAFIKDHIPLHRFSEEVSYRERMRDSGNPHIK